MNQNNYIKDPITKLFVPRELQKLSRELELTKHKQEIKPRKYDMMKSQEEAAMQFNLQFPINERHKFYDMSIAK